MKLNFTESSVNEKIRLQYSNYFLKVHLGHIQSQIDLSQQSTVKEMLMVTKF